MATAIDGITVIRPHISIDPGIAATLGRVFYGFLTQLLINYNHAKCISYRLAWLDGMSTGQCGRCPATP